MLQIQKNKVEILQEQSLSFTMIKLKEWSETTKTAKE